MNHPHPGSLANYNSLTDKHLAGYFSNARIRRHLQRSGLITRSGRIISEKEYRLNAMRKDHQKYIRECLAQAIFHKVLDMEHHHQVEIKRKLEHSARKERVQRIKVEQSRRSAEEPLLFLSPHPPTAPRNRFGRHRLGDRGQLGHSATLPRPSTAPGNIQHLVRLQPIYNNATTESTLKATSSSRSKSSAFEKEHHFASVGERNVFRPLYSTDFSTAISPYRLPIINNYVIPVPPPPPPKNDKNTNIKFGTPRGRRFRPTTAPNGLDQSVVKDTGKFYRPQIHSNAYVTMIYLGKSVHLSHDLFDYRDEIKIYQQHCGGENVCVYKGKLLEGETFQFISRRHHGFPFSLTFYLNGIQVDRLSSCCEYKHRKGARLGGKHGHFGFVNVERSSPCYRCIIALGLDKQPSPPKRKVTDENEGKKEDSRKDDVSHKLNETSSVVGEENKDSSSQSSSAAGEGKEFGEMEVEATKDEIKSGKYGDEHKRKQTSASENAYDEDFEADEEKSDEKVNEEGQVDDQMNGMSKSPSDDEKDNLDHEKESKNSSQKALQVSDSEQDESDGYSESDLEEDKQDGKRVPSLSPNSMLYSSDDSEGNTRKQDDEKDIHSDYENEVTETQREEGLETEVEEEEEMGEADNTEAKNVPGHRNRMETNLYSMTMVGEKLKLFGSVDTGEDRDDVSLEAEHRSKESSEDEREGDCKSVKEKIAEAFENDPLWSSEPEPSDSSTEDEEEDVTATQDKPEVPDGVSLADEVLMNHRSQRVVEQEEQERQMVGKDRALEEEEVVDEEGSKEAALEEELPAKNVAPIVVEQKVKKELVAEDTELEAAAEELDLEMDSTEKCMSHEKEELSDSEEEIKGEDDVEELEGTTSTDVTSKEGDILYGSQLQSDQIENPNFTEESLVIGKVSEGKEEAVKAAEIVGTRILAEEKIMAVEEYEAMEVVKEIAEADEALWTTFVQRDPVEDTLTTMEEEPERSQTLKGREHEGEAVEKVNDMENETKGAMFLKEDEHLEEEKYVRTELKNISGMGIDPLISGSEEAAETISTDEKASTSEELIDDENTFKGEIPSGVENIIQKVPLTCEEELEKTSPEANEVKNVDIGEDLEQEKGESWVEEPSLDWETEGSISAMEEENKNDLQEEKVITEESESSDELSTGGEATIKTTVKANERAQEEDNLMQAVEEDTGGAEEMMISEETVPERKLVIEKEELVSEEPINTVPEAIALVAEETTGMAEAEGKVDAEEAGREVGVKGEAEEAEGEVGVKGEAEEAEGEVGVKGEAEEAEGEVGVKGEAEEAEGEVGVKGEAEEAEGEVGVKGEAEEAEGEVGVKGEAEEAGREVGVKGEAEGAEGEVGVKGELDEEAEKGKVDKRRVDTDKAERAATIKLEVEEIEKEVVAKREVDAAEAIGNVTVKLEVEVEEEEGEVAVKGEGELEDSGTEREVVSVDIGPEVEMVSEVTIMGREDVVNILGVKVAEAEQIPESSAPEVSSEEGLTQEKRVKNEPTIHDKEENPFEETAVWKIPLDLQMKEEEVTAEKEEEKETSAEELMTEGVVSLKVVEEALLIGIQQLITDVSQLSVGVDDNGEECEVESLAEEKSSWENPVREDLENVVAKEKKTAQGDEADERGTAHEKEICLEEKDGRENTKTGAGDYPGEKLLGTETVPLRQSGGEHLQELSAPIISLEPPGMSDLRDEH